MIDRLKVCKICSKCNDIIRIDRGNIYPCLYGSFKTDNFKGACNLYIRKEDITQTCTLQKKITDFDFNEECEFFVENMINMEKMNEEE